MHWMLIQSGPCVIKMAPYNSATKNRVFSKHACFEKTRFFVAELYGAILITHGPLWMSIQCIAPIEVWAHTGHHSHAAPLRSSHTLTEEITAVQEFSMAMKPDF